jgi:hypothetical protein
MVATIQAIYGFVTHSCGQICSHWSLRAGNCQLNGNSVSFIVGTEWKIDQSEGFSLPSNRRLNL